MKIDKQKLFNAMSYIVEINETDFKDLDLSDLFNGVDLTKERKDELFWIYENLDNMEILKKIINTKTN